MVNYDVPISLQVASGPLLNEGVESVRENVEPLSHFEEVASSLGPHQVHSGWLLAGMRYAFRVRLHTDQGSVSHSLQFHIFPL